MMEWILAQPFAIAALFLTGVAAVRSQSTYWVGRGIRAGIIRTGWARRISEDKTARARQQLERWGWPLIPLSFLTIGLQTAINVSAGLIGWRWLWYTIAAIPGWIMWGCVYAAGGLAVFVALAALAARSPWLVVLTVFVVVAAIVVLILARRRRTSPAVVLVEAGE
ncbi:MAG: hypothetical protein LBV00_12520 [Propionibacteriaceae bacterium]|jgi:membrane protein DedA with SNARE-associated domain|nr:hypothetical protein [Propionibacteriaceae bacterium]